MNNPKKNIQIIMINGSRIYISSRLDLRNFSKLPGRRKDPHVFFRYDIDHGKGMEDK